MELHSPVKRIMIKNLPSGMILESVRLLLEEDQSAEVAGDFASVNQAQPVTLETWGDFNSNINRL